MTAVLSNLKPDIQRFTAKVSGKPYSLVIYEACGIISTVLFVEYFTGDSF
jgi:hypothetical protein